MAGRDRLHRTGKRSRKSRFRFRSRRAVARFGRSLGSPGVGRGVPEGKRPGDSDRRPSAAGMSVSAVARSGARSGADLWGIPPAQVRGVSKRVEALRAEHMDPGPDVSCGRAGEDHKMLCVRSEALRAILRSVAPGAQRFGMGSERLRVDGGTLSALHPNGSGCARVECGVRAAGSPSPGMPGGYSGKRSKKPGFRVGSRVWRGERG